MIFSNHALPNLLNDTNLLKLQNLIKIAIPIFICCILSSCASIKSVTDSTTSSVKNIDTSSVICLFSNCPGYEEFKTAKKLDSQGLYQGALKNIDIALSKDSKNEKYQKYKREITLKIQTQQFTTVWNYYESIQKEDLDKKEKELIKLISIADSIKSCGNTTTYSDKVSEEFKRFSSDKEAINNLSNMIHDAFSNSDCDKGLELLTQIKPYRGYFERTSKIFPSIESYREKLDECLNMGYKQCSYEKVIRSLNLIDTIAEDQKYTQKFRMTISSFYRDKGDKFLNRKMTSTALMFFALANRYNPDYVDKDFYHSCFSKLKDYNEKIYVEINSGWGKEDKKKVYQENIIEEINKIYGSYFEKADSSSDSTKAILINIERVENNIEQSQPQLKYSKFISGYNPTTIHNEING